jgi:ActD protein
MREREDLVAVFDDPDRASHALAALEGQGVTAARVASPAAYPAVNQTGHPGPWRALGWIALVGALTGLGCAIALQVATSRSMGLIVGGKPIVSWTAFGVVMFELTMLFGGIFNFTALVLLSAFTRRQVSRRARAAVGSERIVVVVAVDGWSEERRAEVRRALAAAVEVVP